MATHTLADYNAAIQAMYGLASNEQERQQADKWLQHFCRSTSAWEIANAVIANPQTDAASPHMAFACKTLLDKISLDYEELPSDTAKLALREAVSTHVMRWGLGAGTPGTILKKLSLCLASLAVQMHWTDIFTYCTELIGKAQPGQEVNVTRLVLQLLAALPVGTYKGPSARLFVLSSTSIAACGPHSPSLVCITVAYKTGLP